VPRRARGPVNEFGLFIALKTLSFYFNDHFIAKNVLYRSHILPLLYQKYKHLKVGYTWSGDNLVKEI
jgi:hypothetical protein